MVSKHPSHMSGCGYVALGNISVDYSEDQLATFFSHKVIIVASRPKSIDKHFALCAYQTPFPNHIQLSGAKKLSFAQWNVGPLILIAALQDVC
jgi:hypothetical protein